MNYILSFFFCCVALGTFSQVKSNQYALLWEVQNPVSGNKSYLFGSIHSNDRRVFDLPDSVYYALDASEMVILETDIFSIFEGFDALQGGVNLKYDRKGKPYTSSTRASQTAFGDENGMPQFLDAFFQQYCHNAGKEFLALESVDYQVETFEEVSSSSDFEGTNYENFISSKEEMIRLYQKGDINGIHSFVREGLSFSPNSYEQLIVDRNIDMAVKLDNELQERTVFCAVGAGHLAGESGLLQLLRDMGYRTRRMEATYSDLPTREMLAVQGCRKYELLLSDIRLSLMFPGKPVEVELRDDQLTRFIYRDLGQGNTYEVAVYNRGETQSWEDAALNYLPSPEESPYEKIKLPNGGEAIQGLGQEYWDRSLSWTRVLLTEDFVVVLKASGGNKFMNSPRAFRFFDTLSMW
jgi:uncharacterized protein YbaP (TraB family)